MSGPPEIGTRPSVDLPNSKCPWGYSPPPDALSLLPSLNLSVILLIYQSALTPLLSCDSVLFYN